MRQKKKILVVSLFLMISSVIMVPFIASAYSSSVNFTMTKWTSGINTGVMHTLGKGTATFSGSEHLSYTPGGNYTVSAQLMRTKGDGWPEYYGTQTMNVLSNSNTQDFYISWTTDCYCVNYYLTLGITPQDCATVTGSGTLENT